MKFIQGYKTYDGRKTAGIYVESSMLRYEYALFYETS